MVVIASFESGCDSNNVVPIVAGIVTACIIVLVLVLIILLVYNRKFREKVLPFTWKEDRKGDITEMEMNTTEKNKE